MKEIVVFSGAGMSAESGLKTFRDSDGLWENYDVAQVATPEAWAANPELVLRFYNARRQQVLEASPNLAHQYLKKLEEKHNVHVITQNIDDLHERAGSTKVLHLHGEILKSRSANNPSRLFEQKRPIKLGDVADDGYQLRPHVVWFGEAVPELDNAKSVIEKADILIIIGTSLNVYPAAGLVYCARKNAKIYLIDPGDVKHPNLKRLEVIQKSATEGIPILVDVLMRAE